MLNADEAGLARRMKANGETAATIWHSPNHLYRCLAEGGED